jgi:hypothetical protein
MSDYPENYASWTSSGRLRKLLQDLRDRGGGSIACRPDQAVELVRAIEELGGTAVCIVGADWGKSRPPRYG